MLTYQMYLAAASRDLTVLVLTDIEGMGSGLGVSLREWVRWGIWGVVVVRLLMRTSREVGVGWKLSSASASFKYSNSPYCSTVNCFKKADVRMTFIGNSFLQPCGIQADALQTPFVGHQSLRSRLWSLAKFAPFLWTLNGSSTRETLFSPCKWWVGTCWSQKSTEMCRRLSDCSYLKSTSLPDEPTNFGIGLNKEGFQKRWKC